MKKSSKLTALVMVTVFAVALLAGCGKKEAPSADKSMDAYYQLIVRHKADGMTDLGIDSAEVNDTLDVYKQSTISSLKDNFKSAGIKLSTKDAENIYQALSQALADLKYEVSVDKQEDKEASVTVKAQYIDYLSVFKDAKKKTVDALKPQHIETKEDAQKLLVQNVAKGFKTMKPSSNMKSKTFTLTKQNIKSGEETVTLYFPKDSKQTGSDLINLVTGR
ncbi:MAG: hypothetical protein KH180_02540 [Anaerostipes sp.]|nr:hypothetical protein [Anaerostipes sp.]